MEEGLRAVFTLKSRGTQLLNCLVNNSCYHTVTLMVVLTASRAIYFYLCFIRQLEITTLHV